LLTGKRLQPVPAAGATDARAKKGRWPAATEGGVEQAMCAINTHAPQRLATTYPLPRDDLVPSEQDVSTWLRIPSIDGQIFSHTESQVKLTAKPHGELSQTDDIARLWISEGI
jgi:hypothetical protein